MIGETYATKFFFVKLQAQLIQNGTPEVLRAALPLKLSSGDLFAKRIRPADSGEGLNRMKIEYLSAQ